MSDVTRILTQIEAGNPAAAQELLPLVYDELRKLAAARLAREKPGQTLSATSLVHEAYVRLVDNDATLQWHSRGHFFAAAAEAMRRIIVEAARAKKSLKRGGNFERIELSDIARTASGDRLDLLALDEALSEFEQSHPEKAQIIKLRFFAGLSLEEAAQAAGISRATADRHWRYARAWLFGRLHR
jgi:RNA polymerase sigma factor (TIGR02999 family)